MFRILCCLIISLIFTFCTKKIGTNPALAYSDGALLDSATNTIHKYYKNDPITLLSGSNGPHGNFKLRFNNIAFSKLTDNGKLPKLAIFPEGSLIVKDIYKNGNLALYAYMYKHNNSWIWGEAESNGKFLFTAKDGQTSCVGCHNQTGNRDQVVTFNFH